MNDFVKKIIGDIEGKKEWKAMEARAKALPEDYRVAYDEIKRYLWTTSGVTTIKPFKVLLDRFEDGAATGKPVLEITGEDVAAFADGLVRNEKTYIDDYRDQLNRNLAAKLKK